MMRRFLRSGRMVLLGAALLVAARPAAAQLQIASADGKTSLKLGLLGQLQAESLDTANGKDSSDNLFVRRLRLLANFKMSDKITVFLDTDSPNLGKGNPDGSKNNADIFIQDFIATDAFSKAFQLDGGMLLLPQSYNHAQSAATLMALDYGPYTFVESVPTTSRTGRDYGVQARGYLGGDHLEYRLGAFQGVRGPDSTHAFRYAGRLAFYVFGPETTYFYRGTSFGKTRTLSLGASFDRQEDYNAYGGDLFWEQPVNGGDGLTVQADFNEWDGDTFIRSLPEQRAALVEIGYYLHGLRLQPWFQWSKQDLAATGAADEKRIQGGLGYIRDGHNANVKLAWTRIDRDRAKKRDQIQLQVQLFAF